MSTVLTGCGSSGGKNGEVHVYTFGDYIDPDLVGEFEDQTGIKVVLDTFDTNEEMYPVIKNNSAQYDVVCMSDYMVEKMIGEKLLAELDYNNIPNIKNIDKSYLKIAESYDPGNKYAVPHTWGTMGIIYNTKKIPEGSITSWNDLWNKKYSGQIVMPDSMRDTMAIALKAKGYSLNSTDEKQIKEATQYLIAQKPLVYKYANDSARDLILGGSCDIAVIWSGEVYYCKKTNTDLAYVVPKEGSEEFEDSWVVTKTAKNKENAEKWINFMCDKKTAMKNFEYLTYSIPNVSVIDKVKNEKDQAMMDVLFPKEAVLKNCEALKSLGAENDDMYTKYWNQFKGE
jgi:Spermidine/putrescine-binding periplasmic protein